MKEYLLFKKMLAPLLLQILFWPAVGASIYYSIWLIVRGYRIGWVPLIVGTLSVRVLFETLITGFRIYEKLDTIASNVQPHDSDGRIDAHS
ncbi:MAG: hypothetical protein KDE53_39560 [Caldilineaceae bacterium]|nr:hypothetical protein [Caldilineaceae bacterium]MCB0128923.1 hypothetical protein [Caldilineaceae bacterium]